MDPRPVPPADDAMAALAGKYMTFQLADEVYGLPILTVREIIGLMEITRVPRASPFIRGVINLRGKVIPVIDLRLKFDLPACQPTEQTVIIVVQVVLPTGPQTMGVLVDQVLEVRAIDASQLEAPPLLDGSGAATRFIVAVGKVEKRVLFLLDVAKVVSAGEAAEIASAAA